MSTDLASAQANSFIAGCDAISAIVAAREGIEPFDGHIVARWLSRRPEEAKAVLDRGIEVPFRERRQVAFLHARRCAESAARDMNSDQLTAAIQALVDGVWIVARSNETPPPAQIAAVAACLLLLEGVRHPRGGRVRAYARDLTNLTETRAYLWDVLGLTWERFEHSVAAAQRARMLRPQDTLPARDTQRTFDIASSLLEPGRSTQAIGSVDPTYDRIDEKRRVRRVTLSGFRGSPNALTFDLEHRSKPVSAIVLGDNGAGKSTLVDAIEFALQGRIGRSRSFDGPLGPSAASFAADDLPTVEVTLDDGSVVRRSLLRRGDGKLSESGERVRPGFQLAPIALKRQDILRFLDTASLARGHIFFDYFPATAGEMAIRPEEALERLDDEAFELRVERGRAVPELATMLGVAPEEIDGKEGLVKVLQERVTGGVRLRDAFEDGTWDAVEAGLRRKAERVLAIFGRATGIKKERERGVETLNPMRYRMQADLLARALGGIGDDLTSAFREITGARHVQRIDVVFGKSGPVSLDIVVELATGKFCFPQQIFSEGYRDLLAVLFFAVVARRAAERGQVKLLILDDVFQSVDSSIRSGVVNYLLRSFKDWQIVFTVHDRLWFEQLRTAFRRAGHPFVERELRRWSFEKGPEMSLGASVLTSHLQQQLASGDAVTICGAAGRLLEQACDALSWRLGSSVTRRREDKYTLGDLWPGVQKALKKTRYSVLCEPVDELYVLRNLAGAHYNEWADALSLDEATRFGDAVLALVNELWCDECHDWVAALGTEIRCQGGHRSS